MKRLILCFPIAALALLGGCGADTEEQAAAPVQAAPKTQPAAPKPAGPMDEATRIAKTMAKAVGDGKPGAAVNIRYDFRGKPAVGTPTELELAFIPNPGVDALEATISGMEGVTVAGSTSANFTGVEAGKPYLHTISVLPDRTGVFYLTVAVNTQIAGSTLGRTFSIPFVVGEVPVKQKSAPAAKDATGQPIESMKAKESAEERKG